MEKNKKYKIIGILLLGIIIGFFIAKFFVYGGDNFRYFEGRDWSKKYANGTIIYNDWNMAGYCFNQGYSGFGCSGTYEDDFNREMRCKCN